MTELFFKAYMHALLWSSHDTDRDGDEVNFDELGMAYVTPPVLEEARRSCEAFWKLAEPLIPAGKIEQAGHDFALTRNRHGVGFWDRPEVYGQTQADRLTELAHEAGAVDLYLGDDGKIYC